MIPVFPLLGWEYAKKKRDARKRMDMWGNQWKNRRMISFYNLYLLLSLPFR